MNPADVADGLRQVGIRRIFAVPGGGASLDVLDRAEGFADIVTPHHEAAGGVMAGVTHRITGELAAVSTIKGPGLANLLPGLACARLERWPLISLSESFPVGTGPAIVHKRMDHRLLTAGITKAHGVASCAADLHRAAALALADEPGPVTLDLAAGGDQVPQPSDPDHERHDHDRAVIERIGRARRPVVIGGTAAMRRGLGQALADLGVPVLTTAAAKGLIDELLPHAAGVYTGVGLEHAPERRLLTDADLVIGIGLRSAELLSSTTHGTPTILVDDLAQELSPGIDAEAALPWSASADVFEVLRGRRWGDDLVASLHERLDEHLARLAGFSPASLLPDLARALAPGARLVADTGDFCTLAEHLWRARHGSGFLGTGHSRYMGMGIPMALGSSLADPARPTVLAVGDGGMGSHFGELSIAVERQLPLLVLFMTDGGMSSIIGRALAAGRSTSFLQRDDQRWAAAAEGLGLTAHIVSDQAEALAVIETWRPETGPTFVECRFSPDAYRAMSTGLR